MDVRSFPFDCMFMSLPLSLSLTLCLSVYIHVWISGRCSAAAFTNVLHFIPFSLEYRKKNRTHEAVRMFKRCTDIDATYVQCWKELFRLFRGSQAALILSDAIKANSENVELRLTLGHWLLNNGNDHLPNANIYNGGSTRICRCVCPCVAVHSVHQCAPV